MDKHGAALVLNDIGTLLELNGADPFRARAFYAAARAIERVEGELPELVRSGRLRAVEGVGATTARVLEELVATGGSTLHTELRERTPEGMLEILGVPGLGPRRIHLLHEALGIETLDDLAAAAAGGRIARLPGFGEKTQRKILEGVAFVRAGVGRRRQPEAFRAAERLIGFLEGLPEVTAVKLGGELRRRLETVGSVDVIAATTSPETVVAAFLELPGVTRAEREGADAAWASYADALPLHLRCVAPAALPAAWLTLTGPEAHVAALAARAEALGLRLTQDALWQGDAPIALADEPDLYQRLDLAWVPPELRDDPGWVKVAEAGPLPELIDDAWLRGCFHCHTTASDGKAPLAELAGAAIARGWRYLGIADHSQAASYAGGLTPDAIRAQHAEIDAWNAGHGAELWVFKGIEADILPDGRVDYEDLGDEVLGSFDYVVASVHSGFGQSEAEQTARVARALENPHVTFLGHPTGRLLLSREGIRLDLRAVIETAGRLGVGIEINANPRRLELDWRWWPLARSLGVRAAINPDAHSAAGLGDVVYGVGVARKGGLGRADVVNAWELDEVQRYFERRKRGKAKGKGKGKGKRT